MTYQEVLKQGVIQLEEAGIEEALVDARTLFFSVTGFTLASYYMKATHEFLDEKKIQEFDRLIHLRLQKNPIQYILKSQEFYGLEFYVDENVLIPRQDTEVLVEECLKKLPEDPLGNGKILDLCTGSGCIAISLKKNRMAYEVSGVDLSEGALAVARKNSERLKIPVTFIKSDLFESLTGTYEMIVSNPPYIESQVIEGLADEVKEKEPRMALDGGGDGLLFYREIIKNSLDYLNIGGWLLFEIGYDQGASVSNLMIQEGFFNVSIVKDLAGLDRVVMGRK